MMLQFRCDRCGHGISREEAYQFVMIPKAYVVGADREILRAELCPRCAERLKAHVLAPRVTEAKEMDGEADG